MPIFSISAEDAPVAQVGPGMATAYDDPDSRGLSRDVLGVAVVIFLECAVESRIPHPWFPLHEMLAAPIAFAVALLFFGRESLRPIPGRPLTIRSTILLIHVPGVALVGVTAAVLLRVPALSGISYWTTVCVWFLANVLALISLVGTFFTSERLMQIARDLRRGKAWAYAGVIAFSSMFLRELVRAVWNAPGSAFGRWLQSAAFYGTRGLLKVFYGHIVADPSLKLLGTERFQVLVAGSCSGIESLALMFALAVGWIVYLRRELKVVRAVCMVPLALGAVWLLNLVRLALLIGIGDSGHPEIADAGFHSEAGWIFFNLVAIGFLLMAQGWSWLRTDTVPAAALPVAADGHRNVAAIYLAPFLAIFVASIVARAFSAGFEWLYPLRLVASLAVIWNFRSEYRRLDLRFGWLAGVAGIGVFLMWLGFARHVETAGSDLAFELSRIAPWQRFGWRAARVFAAVVTVPFAEELAFRGFLARRVVNADIERVPFSGLTAVAIGASSAVFGVLHGSMWIAGIFSGVIFALVARRRNRLGEAVVAHAVANLLIALWVLVTGDYSLW